MRKEAKAPYSWFQSKGGFEQDSLPNIPTSKSPLQQKPAVQIL